MSYAFVAEHRGQFSVRAMCRCLRIQPSGFYAWLQAPLSARAQEDRRQTELLQKAWAESGKVYGYRKLHDDLVEQGDPRRRKAGRVRLHRDVLQPEAQTSEEWDVVARRVRAAAEDET